MPTRRRKDCFYNRNEGNEYRQLFTFSTVMGNRGGIHDVMVETVGVFNDGFLKSRNKIILFTG